MKEGEEIEHDIEKVEEEFKTGGENSESSERCVKKLSTKRCYQNGCSNAVAVAATNQSVENAGIAFVKGANERNEFF